MKNISFALPMIVVIGVASAQVPAPKHAHRENDNLPQRFNDLRCALVLIQAGQKLGTGFFISADGEVATASHVVGDRQFSLNPGNLVTVSLSIPATFSITDSTEAKTEITADKVEHNPDAWLSDVAMVQTGAHPPCWLREADDKTLRPGEHLIAMGFPGLAFQALTIYTGIMSARMPNSGFPVAFLRVGPNPQDLRAVQSPNEVIRVQMPISPGLSGAPVIDDNNRAVGIITSAGGWSQDLDNLLMVLHSGALNNMSPPPPPVPPNSPPNTVSFNLNLLALTAELAGLYHDYASPGYGDAVPLRYLRKQVRQNPQPSSHNR